MSVPVEHGAVYLQPALAECALAALKNHRTLPGRTLWDLSALDVRKELDLPTDRPLVMSGHQPVFFHPGLWAKCLTASRLAELVSGTALHKITDTDCLADEEFFLPILDAAQRPERRAFRAFVMARWEELREIPYAFLPTPEEGEILPQMSASACPAAFKKWVQDLREDFSRAGNWDDFHLRVLARLDKISETQRMYRTASGLWKSVAFRKFTGRWLMKAEQWTDDLNASLEDYRTSHSIRHALEPVPNLKIEGDWVETPFWAAREGEQRQTLWARPQSEQVLLREGVDGPEVSIKAGSLRAGELPSEFSVWPKALPQTLFCRFFLCDLFIHGLGGGAYEEVNDLLLRRWFPDQEPPMFGVATATYYVRPEERERTRNERLKVEQAPKWARVFEKNPEALVTREKEWKTELSGETLRVLEGLADRDDLQKLAFEKGEFIQQWSEPTERIRAGKRIREINELFLKEAPEMTVAMEQAQKRLKELQEEEAVWGYRGYPFFCYDHRVFQDLAKKIR